MKINLEQAISAGLCTDEIKDYLQQNEHLIDCLPPKEKEDLLRSIIYLSSFFHKVCDNLVDKTIERYEDEAKKEVRQILIEKGAINE